MSLKCDGCNTEMYDLVEAARILSVHPETLRRYVRYNEVDCKKVERGLYFSYEELLKHSDIKEKV